MAGNLDGKLRLLRIHFRVLLHDANMRHGTNGFTSLPKEGVLRIFSIWKIRRLRPGLNPRTWVPKASTLPLDHRSPLNWRAKLIFMDCKRRSASKFLSSRLQHKVDPGPSPCELHNQFQRTDFTTLKHSFFGVIFSENWSWIFSEQKWAIAIRDTTHNTMRSAQRFTTPWWLVEFLSSSARVECHLTVWMKTWGLSSISETYLTKLLLLLQ